jgi:hypothetical protein
MKKPFAPSPRPPSDTGAATARATIDIKATCDKPEVTAKNPSSDPTTGRRRVTRPGLAALLSQYPSVLIDLPARLARNQFSIADYERLARSKGRGRAGRTKRRPD